jgi:hypothetical protein
MAQDRVLPCILNKDSGTFILLLLPTIFIFALVGLQLFASTYTFNPDTLLLSHISDPSRAARCMSNHCS